jgi:hypothetical protein
VKSAVPARRNLCMYESHVESEVDAGVRAFSRKAVPMGQHSGKFVAGPTAGIRWI